MCVLGCCDSIPPNVFLQLLLFFQWCCDSTAFLNALKLCVCVCACLSGCCDSMPQSFFLKLLRQHSLSKRIEVELL